MFSLIWMWEEKNEVNLAESFALLCLEIRSLICLFKLLSQPGTVCHAKDWNSLGAQVCVTINTVFHKAEERAKDIRRRQYRRLQLSDLVLPG